ncbi:MAG: flagellar basal body-associated FliL family protein, partial [Pseudomonadota bacterium]|nr:flagellar basal body-associated FliL family protein [Pseudomonadota bacterium]
DVALRVSNTEAAAIASQHKPYMRHHLVMLFSAQEADVMTSPTGRETLRKQALEELRELLTELEGNPAIDDVYFNNFVVQN